MNRIAIDWDESELRLVVGQARGGGKVRITDAAVLPLEINGEKSDVYTVLREAVSSRGLEQSEALITIGRGKAELRELQLPPVPNEELPDMVRFQAIRSFASSGDSSTIDFLVTERTESGVEMIAAAIGPKELNEVRKICKSASLEPKRVALRPLSAASLYLTQKKSDAGANVVLVDLLADDAEIVVARDGQVIFVRTVRMPSSEPARSRALSGELRRSLFACGDDAKPEKVVLWGKASVHEKDRDVLTEACGAHVDVIDPFDLVDVDSKLISQLPEHVGRLAPLVGLLAADEAYPERLVDFLNPRKRPEEKPNHIRTAVLIAVPVLATLFIGYSVFSKFKAMDDKIDELKAANTEMQPSVDLALQSIDRTEKVDQFLDGNVLWLDEIRRLAERMPGSDEMIVRGISASADQRLGGGELVVSGGAVSPDAIDVFENSLRDVSHSVVGDGATEGKSNDAYRWGFSETISVNSDFVRNTRYERILAKLNEEPVVAAEAVPVEGSETNDTEGKEIEGSEEVLDEVEQVPTDLNPIEPETVPPAEEAQS